ncbi:MAG: thiamine pyrophosphate-binding protein [Halobacteriovoraceae bacterium]|nr:thiamine pyrophosphate-binding protein [Halobacteriovoraceae bacterium]
MMRIADFLMQRLHEHGVGHVFTVTGRGSLFLNDALAAHKEIDAVCNHHEQAAAYAAVAYAETKDSLGACMVSTGCASTNAITGALNAWQDGIPCIFISGQNKLKETSRYTGVPIRTYGQQETDLIPMVESITKYAVMITDPKRAVYEIDKAFHLAQEGRKGPVWIDIPLDVQNMRIRPEECEQFIPESIEILKPSKSDIEYLKNALNEAERPTVIIGSGVRSADAIQDLEKFVTKYKIPLTYSASSPDTYGSSNELSIGSVGAMGCSRAASFAVQNSDLLLVIGCRMSSMTAGEFCKFARAARVIVVDIDEVEHSKEGVAIDKLILSDAREFLQTMNEPSEVKQANPEWIDKCLHWKEVFPNCEEGFKQEKKVDLYHLAEAMSEVFPANGSLVTDSGLIEVILPPNMKFKPGQRSIHPASQGSMGSALPSIIGTHFGADRSVVCVVGDGSIMMNLQELETISYNKIPAKIFVISNNVYAVIRKRQKDLFGSRTIGTDPENGVSCPDFRDVAATFKLNYAKIENAKNLTEDLDKVLKMDGPVLCEVMGLEDQRYIHCSYTKNAKRRVVQRPIEDQSPFLDRELFLSEMIIEPIDQ